MDDAEDPFGGNCVLHCNHSALCSIIITISMMTTACVNGQNTQQYSPSDAPFVKTLCCKC